MFTQWSKLVPWVALLIAMYGAVLSTVQLHDSRKEKERQLDVSLSFSSATSKGVLYPKGLMIIAMNPGYQEVNITAIGFFLPDGVAVYMNNRQFPNQISPGSNVLGMWTGKDLTSLCDLIAAKGFKENVTLIGFCQDGLGVIYKSSPLQFNIQVAKRVARDTGHTP